MTDGTISKERKEELERKYLKTEIFSVKLWAREAKLRLDEMADPNSTYNRICKIINVGYSKPEKEVIIFSTPTEARKFSDVYLTPNDFIYTPLGVAWEDTTMTGRMIAYHVNDFDFHIDSKHGDLHAPSTAWLWGNVVTNKANRTDVKYARLFCPEGKRMNWITRATFKKMARNMKHEYITPWSNDQVEACVKAITSLNNYQAQRIFRSLIKHRTFEILSGGGRTYQLEQFLIHLKDLC